jgi:hypothetical protein
MKYGRTASKLKKEASVEWHHANLNPNKKIEAASSAGTVMATVFWDKQEFVFVDIIPNGTIINPEAYVAIFMHV